MNDKKTVLLDWTDFLPYKEIRFCTRMSSDCYRNYIHNGVLVFFKWHSSRNLIMRMAWSPFSYSDEYDHNRLIAISTMYIVMSRWHCTWAGPTYTCMLTYGTMCGVKMALRARIQSLHPSTEFSRGRHSRMCSITLWVARSHWGHSSTGDEDTSLVSHITIGVKAKYH